MKRSAFLIIPVAAGIAAIVVLTTGAFGGTSGRSNRPGDASSQGDAAYVSCLESHGVQVPSADPGALKGWLAEHANDPAVQAAAAACKQDDGTAFAPPPPELIACLERHGVDVPSDAKQTPGALKPWLAVAMNRPGISAALAECVGAPASGGKTQ